LTKNPKLWIRNRNKGHWLKSQNYELLNLFEPVHAHPTAVHEKDCYNGNKQHGKLDIGLELIASLCV
jgi:hypothetical protein